MITSQIIWDPKDILPYKDEWTELYTHGINEPSTSFSWSYALFCNHLRKQDIFFIVRLYENSKTVSFLPMIATSEKLLGLNLVTIYFASERYNTHSDILAYSKDNQLISSMFLSFKNLPIKWDIFRTSRLLDNSPYLKAFEETVNDFYPNNIIRHEQPSYFLELPDSYEQYLSQRSGKFRNYLKRMTKKIAKQGNIKYINLNNDDNIDEVFSTIVAIETNSWKESHGTSITAIDRQKNFYKMLCQYEHKEKRLHLSFLYIDKKPIAYNMGIISNGTYYYLKTSYDSTFRNLSPSTVLRAELIKSLIEENNAVFFDFPGEPYEWEQQWTSILRWHKSYVIFNNSIKAKLFSFMSILKNKIKPHRDERKLQFCNPKDLNSTSN